jgi:hypothetical protein
MRSGVIMRHLRVRYLCTALLLLTVDFDDEPSIRDYDHGPLPGKAGFNLPLTEN